MHPELVFSIHHASTTATVWLSGALTLESGASLRIALETLVEPGLPLALDVTGVDDMDALGEEILAQCVADAMWRGSDVVLRSDAAAAPTPLRYR
jgi:anti-anti-sigma regulatory factor